MELCPLSKIFVKNCYCWKMVHCVTQNTLQWSVRISQHLMMFNGVGGRTRAVVAAFSPRETMFWSEHNGCRPTSFLSRKIRNLNPLLTHAKLPFHSPGSWVLFPLCSFLLHIWGDNHHFWHATENESVFWFAGVKGAIIVTMSVGNTVLGRVWVLAVCVLQQGQHWYSERPHHAASSHAPPNRPTKKHTPNHTGEKKVVLPECGWLQVKDSRWKQRGEKQKQKQKVD